MQAFGVLLGTFKCGGLLIVSSTQPLHFSWILKLDFKTTHSNLAMKAGRLNS